MDGAAAQSKTAEDKNTGIYARCFKERKVLMYWQLFSSFSRF